jgi:hypothetical protein
MAKFKAIRNNFGYLGTYWHKGEVVDAEKLPNEHFVPYSQGLAMEAEEKAAKKVAVEKAAELVEKAVKARGKKKD